jgi:hypothetical protein
MASGTFLVPDGSRIGGVFRVGEEASLLVRRKRSARRDSNRHGGNRARPGLRVAPRRFVECRELRWRRTIRLSTSRGRPGKSRAVSLDSWPSDDQEHASFQSIRGYSFSYTALPSRISFTPTPAAVVCESPVRVSDPASTPLRTPTPATYVASTQSHVQSLHPDAQRFKLGAVRQQP